MPLADSAVADALGALSSITYVSVHTAVPSAAGDAEVTGGSYARVALTHGAVSGRTRPSGASLTHNIPSNTTAVALGFWTASSGGTFKGWAPVQPSNALKGIGVVTTADVSTDTIDAAAHGLAVGNRVVLYGAFGGSLPTGLSGSVVYYVKTVSTDSFTLSATSGGATVDITGSGSLVWQQCSPETFSNAGTLTTASGSLIFDLSTVNA